VSDKIEMSKIQIKEIVLSREGIDNGIIVEVRGDVKDGVENRGM
jgi:hypothetical protein